VPRQCDASVYIHAGVPTGDWMKLARVAEIGNVLSLQLTVAHPSPKGRERKHQGETRATEGWPIYPAARCEACSTITGTRTWMVVPPMGVD